jgi:hypothetical protein
VEPIEDPIERALVDRMLRPNTPLRLFSLERVAKAGARAACQDGLEPLATEVQRAQAESGG